ncbi:PREDICTED: cactin-like [Camelina sativa]|uniref:Splicing factor Cactin n=1 Tax=Camelina sativa TaxID=90675 RepID=A0ABM0YXS5_CAMSA|nr:PREDICTED: cactin-like [Camelina sativa]
MGSHGKSKNRRIRDESDDSSLEEIKEYMAKRALKKAVRASKKLKTWSVSGYSNDSNPSGDSNLTETFVWRKKIEKDVYHGASPDEFSVKAERRRRRGNLAEDEKVKNRREESAVEKARHEEDMVLLARERARAEFQDWKKKEEKFNFYQSKVRPATRLDQGRAKPIDVLYKYVDDSDDVNIELSEPYMVFKGLDIKDMEELRDDIKMYLDWDRKTPTRVQYWEALSVICDWELAEAPDVRELLDGKTHAELVQLQFDIESQLRCGAAKVVEYWEAVLERISIYKAKACLKEINAEILRKHKHRLEKLSDVVEENEEEVNGMNLSDDEETSSLEEAGSFSPELIHGDDSDQEAIDPDEDKTLLERERMVVLEEQRKRLREAMDSNSSQVEDNLELKAMKRMGATEEGDVVFGSNAEVNLDSKVYKWDDKYRPRKPKYFNRVHTGYEWNKYNQTHYDHNPPPKFVQGYKFNIFYPELVDKTKVPTCVIEKDGTSSETCIIRFEAGSPYEDIAFRVVNKEWDKSHKKGYKNTFENGILHLYFNFKRHRYRR